MLTVHTAGGGYFQIPPNCLLDAGLPGVPSRLHLRAVPVYQYFDMCVCSIPAAVSEPYLPARLFCNIRALAYS